MFIGHYALAFGAKRYVPTVSLGTLFLACQFADLLWPTLVVLGIELVEVDPALLGGLQIKMGSRLVDASIRTKLNNLTNLMKGA